jgi:hypothetical protein
VPTFLVNAKMNPALRARVERSLGGRSRAARLPPRFIAVLRFASLAGLVASVLWFVSFQRQQASELDHEKRELSARLALHSDALSPSDLLTVTRAKEWLRRLKGDYGGDWVNEQIATTDAVERALRQPAAYVRAEVEKVHSDDDIDAALASSPVDALVRCLYEPPDSDTEKALLGKLDALRSSAGASSNFASLGAAVVALPLLEPSFRERIARAERIEDVHALARVVDGAPLSSATRAARAEVLIVAFDEPKEAGSVVELDGTHRHAVRVHAVDLRNERELWRQRRLVDPAWISEAKRVKHARALVDCRLGYDVSRALRQ